VQPAQGLCVRVADPDDVDEEPEDVPRRRRGEFGDLLARAGLHQRLRRLQQARELLAVLDQFGDVSRHADDLHHLALLDDRLVPGLERVAAVHLDCVVGLLPVQRPPGVGAHRGIPAVALEYRLADGVPGFALERCEAVSPGQGEDPVGVQREHDDRHVLDDRLQSVLFAPELCLVPALLDDVPDPVREQVDEGQFGRRKLPLAGFRPGKTDCAVRLLVDRDRRAHVRLQPELFVGGMAVRGGGPVGEHDRILAAEQPPAVRVRERRLGPHADPGVVADCLDDPPGGVLDAGQNPEFEAEPLAPDHEHPLELLRPRAVRIRRQVVEPLEGPLAVPYLLAGLPVLRDVPEHNRQPRVCLRPRPRPGGVDPRLDPPVLSGIERLHGGRLPGRQRPLEPLLGLCPAGERLANGFADEPRVGGPEQFAGGIVGAGHRLVGVDSHDTVGEPLQQRLPGVPTLHRRLAAVGRRLLVVSHRHLSVPAPRASTRSRWLMARSTTVRQPAS